ncbi:HK97-gp10 family putative phage morphogenesis protein [Brachyspira aalborgi]|uniref:HK97-gp10 family putative phage morphogenesis protein n=1 Tax=Brachyspira aalborgi TaxID=29522 RepID=UPI0026671AA1|nr:HK97-gp10 family putative phage morphogenesis protein [Brachyspira aalborgi]
MSVKTSVSIRGLDEFRKELERLGGDFKKAIKSGARKGGNKVSQEANAEAKNRGWSEDKYYNVKEKRISKGSDTSVAIRIGAMEKGRGIAPMTNKIKWYKEQGDRYYTRFPEYGTIKQAKQPLLIPIFYKNETYINSCIKREIDKAIENARSGAK